MHLYEICDKVKSEKTLVMEDSLINAYMYHHM